MDTQPLVLSLNRKAEIFTRKASLVEHLTSLRKTVYLAPDQLLHPESGQEYVVRLGKLRVSQFLDDGREITRAVLQAGSLLAIRPAQTHGDNPASDVYNLPEMVMMALGETELWSLPAGSTSPD